jgi:hypothetical protein
MTIYTLLPFMYEALQVSTLGQARNTLQRNEANRKWEEGETRMRGKVVKYPLVSAASADATSLFFLLCVKKVRILLDSRIFLRLAARDEKPMRRYPRYRCTGKCTYQNESCESYHITRLVGFVTAR